MAAVKSTGVVLAASRAVMVAAILLALVLMATPVAVTAERRLQELDNGCIECAKQGCPGWCSSWCGAICLNASPCVTCLKSGCPSFCRPGCHLCASLQEAK